ncbi:MAG: TolC family protein [Bryobacteraceae bacterium]
MPALIRIVAVLVALCAAAVPLAAAAPLTYAQVVERFKANNPTIAADSLNIDESRANEITAGLRPNPAFSVTNDQYEFLKTDPYRPFANVEVIASLSYLFERRNKRELRVESARDATNVIGSTHQDLLRNLLFTLRGAFVSALQAKSLLDLARENLDSYDKVIAVNRDRYNAGDVAKIDFQRIELQRVQFESDLQTAMVDLRTAKIQLLQLLNDRTPIDQFDVAGDFDYKETVLLPDELRQQALAARPDLQAAAESIAKAQADNRLAWANGSTDPTVGIATTLNGSPGGSGYSIDIPLRIFDRNQGEKQRTAIEITRTAHARNAVVASVYSDVDTAYTAVESVRNLIRPYREKYLEESRQVRETVSFSYQHGAASLLEFLDAQKQYRDTQLAYRNLVAAYLNAANQLNMAVGREVIP